MKKLLLLLGFYPVAVFGQLFDNTWFLGVNNDTDTTNKIGIQIITFPQGSLQIRQNPELFRFDFNATNTSLSDSSGNVLSYSNGVHIGNADWEIMENGEQITAAWEESGQLWSQWVMALPWPGDASKQLYLYENERINTQMIYSDSLFYSIVSLDYPGGKVISRGNLLLKDTLALGKMNAVKHANGRDWWVIVNENNTNGFYIFLFDPAGIKFKLKIFLGGIVHDGLGQSTVSPNGGHLAYINTIGASYGSYIDVYDFNRCTGELSNARQFHFTHDRAGGGGGFSPNSRFLYVNHTTEAYQYDLTAPDIFASRVQVATYDGGQDPLPTTFYLMQLAPDGKIYSSSTNGVISMHVIHDPDQPGINCQYQQRGLKLKTYNAFSVPTFPNFRLGPLDGSPCDTLGLDNRPVAFWRSERDTLEPLRVYFHDLSYYEPATWLWDFGDGTAGSTERHPVHTFPGPGAYEVCLTVSNANATHTLCRTLTFTSSAVENPDITDQISVGPNPFSNELSVALSIQLRSPVFRLYDQMGRLVCARSLAYGLTEVEVGNLPSGLYFWEVRSGGELVKVGKAVKVE